MTVVLLAHHICWDTSTHEESVGLPRKVAVEVNLKDQEGFDDINRQICDQLSSITGYCVLDYRLQGFDMEADYALQMKIMEKKQ